MNIACKGSNISAKSQISSCISKSNSQFVFQVSLFFQTTSKRDKPEKRTVDSKVRVKRR